MRMLMAILGFLMFPSVGFSSGFFLLEQSPSQMGHAYAGSTAISSDASTIFFNPAGMTELSGQSVSVGLTNISINNSFSDKGSSQTNVGDLQGGSGGNSGGNVTIPNLFYSYSFGDLAVGIGVFSPFGLSTNYDDDWQGRYFGIKSSVETLNINPSIAYKVSEKLSVGFGVNYQTLKADLTSAIDIGTICVATQTKALQDAAKAAAACAAQGLTPQAADATTEVEGDSVGYGVNLGFLFKATEELQLGLSYRQGISHKLDGTAKYKNVPDAFTAGGTTLVDTDAKTTANLPDIVALGIVYRLNPDLTLLTDLAWTRWSAFDELKIEYDSEQDDQTEEFNWKNTYRLSTGARYSVNDEWRANFGLSYDQGPIRGRKERNVRMPDNDRYWIATGFEYNPMTNLSLALSYAHIFFEKSQVERTSSFGHNIKGTFETSVDIVAAQLNYSI